MTAELEATDAMDAPSTTRDLLSLMLSPEAYLESAHLLVEDEETAFSGYLGYSQIEGGAVGDGEENTDWNPAFESQGIDDVGEDAEAGLLGGYEHEHQDEEEGDRDNTRFLNPNGIEKYDIPGEPREAPLYKLWQDQAEVMWFPSHIDMKDEKAHFESLPPGTRGFLKRLVAMFTSMDAMILGNLSAGDGWPAVTRYDVKRFLSLQAAIEAVHTEVYRDLLRNFGLPADELSQLRAAIQEDPLVTPKKNWAEQHLGAGARSDAHRIMARAALEGIFFAGSFGFVWWIKCVYPGLMNGLTKSNEWIQRDEYLHVGFGCRVTTLLPHPIPVSEAAEIFDSAVEVELEFIRSLASEHTPERLDIEQLCEHVRATRNYWIRGLADMAGCGEKSVFQQLLRNPDGSEPQFVPGSDEIALTKRVQFFEKRSSTYPRPTRVQSPNGVEFGGDW